MDPAMIRRQLTPIVQHGLRELQAGEMPQHVLYETSLMAWFVGQGMDPRQAIRMVERNEETWGGATGDQTGEWARGYPSYPAPHGTAFGKTLYHKAPMGKFPMGKGGFGKGGPGLPPLPYPVMQPWGMGNPYMVQGMEYDLGDQSGSDL